jgi:hypothetical protein
MHTLFDGFLALFETNVTVFRISYPVHVADHHGRQIQEDYHPFQED